MPTKNAFWTRIERDVVRVEGPDAATYLQGQLSQDIATLEVGDAAWSLLLQPSGKVDAWLRVAPMEDGAYSLDVDGGFGEAVAARLNRFKLRTKCEITAEPAVPFFAVRGVAGDGLPIVWPGVEGYDVAYQGGGEGEEADFDTYEQLRIRCGVPAMGRELTADTIPAEAGRWLIDASVSFTKGCYTGQELVARIDSRGGNVPRPIRGLVIEGEPDVGAEILDAAGKTVGHLTSVAGSIALAPILRSVQPPATVTVAGLQAEVCEFPLP